jgi:hypothetical protein
VGGPSFAKVRTEFPWRGCDIVEEGHAVQWLHLLIERGPSYLIIGSILSVGASITIAR